MIFCDEPGSLVRNIHPSLDCFAWPRKREQVHHVVCWCVWVLCFLVLSVAVQGRFEYIGMSS